MTSTQGNVWISYQIATVTSHHTRFTLSDADQGRGGVGWPPNRKTTPVSFQVGGRSTSDRWLGMGLGCLSIPRLTVTEIHQEIEIKFNHGIQGAILSAIDHSGLFDWSLWVIRRHTQARFTFVTARNSRNKHVFRGNWFTGRVEGDGGRGWVSDWNEMSLMILNWGKFNKYWTFLYQWTFALWATLFHIINNLSNLSYLGVFWQACCSRNARE